MTCLGLEFLIDCDFGHRTWLVKEFLDLKNGSKIKIKLTKMSQTLCHFICSMTLYYAPRSNSAMALLCSISPEIWTGAGIVT